MDFLLSYENKLVLNEINTLAGFTEISMYPRMWEATGINEKELITMLINLAIQRHERNADLSTKNKEIIETYLRKSVFLDSLFLKTQEKLYIRAK